MNVEREYSDRSDRVLRAWLLALLRFAVTLDHDDRQAVLSIATEMDRLGSRQAGVADFSFFRRTGGELCAAIEEPDNAVRATVLRQHLERIEDERLKRAFAAAVALETPEPRTVVRFRRSRSSDLWRGLEPRQVRGHHLR